MLDHIFDWPPETSTVIGAGLIVGVVVFFWTGLPEVAILAAGVTKIVLPERGERRSKAELAAALVDEAV